MAKDMVSYNKMVEIANMSVEEYRSKYVKTGWFGSGMSDEDIEYIIDRYKDAVDTSSEYGSTWNTLVKEAENSYNEMYADSLDYLKVTANVSDAQWEEAYNASVSDNYASGSTEGIDLENVTIPAGDDNVSIDWSEMQVMKKTQLANGHFVEYEPSDNFGDSSEIGETRNICGGTITYLGKKSRTYDRGKYYEEGGFLNSNEWAATRADNNIITGDNRVNMVHYEGVLGSFDYDADEFSLGYWETEVNGNYIRVPVLHYMNDGAAVNGFNKSYTGFLDGEYIHIPEGLKSMDYMFADTGIVTMPEIPDSVESAHCAFMNCHKLIDGCESSKNDSGIYTGKLVSSSNLKDTSWMFAGCENMRNYFPNAGRNMIDGRYMYAECKSLGWDGETLDNDGNMLNSFEMPDFNNLRYANAFWLQNMFDGCDAAVIKKLQEYINENGGISSEWTDENGAHHNTYDRLVDGVYNKTLEQDISSETARGQILQLIDRESNGMTGVASDTMDLASYAVQTTDNGTLADNSVWAKFRQSDFDATFGNDNEFGNILNHAIPALGTYAVSKSILNKMTNGEHKAISTIGAVAVAAVPQIVGYGSTLTPMLDWTANAIGTDTKVGSFFKSLSDKLKGQATYHTAVSELNADETFESLQESAVKYAGNQIAGMMTVVDGNIAATQYRINGMDANGRLIARDANLLFIACEPEENLKATLTDSIMETSVEALRDKMELELAGAGSDTEKVKEIRDTYSSYYMTLLYNIDVYDNAARQELESVYAVSPELKAQAANGLEKVMRCTAKPLYDQMYELQEEFRTKYGMDFFSDKQLNDTEQSTRSMSITGIGTFNDYDPGKDYSDHSDMYVEKLETYQTALVQAITEASSQEEIDAAYASYYEAAYGWALDEAEAHGVVLDRRGALTSSEKDSFASYVARVEAEQQETVSNKDNGTPASGDDSQTVPQYEPDTDHDSSLPNMISIQNRRDRFVTGFDAAAHTSQEDDVNKQAGGQRDSGDEKARIRAEQVGAPDSDESLSDVMDGLER